MTSTNNKEEEISTDRKKPSPKDKSKDTITIVNGSGGTTVTNKQGEEEANGISEDIAKSPGMEQVQAIQKIETNDVCMI